MRRLSVFFLLLLCTCCLICCNPKKVADTSTPYKDFVYIEDDHFMLNGEPWFPLMMNYKALYKYHGLSARVSPGSYYSSTLAQDFQHIADMGFNCVRICLDTVPDKGNYQALYKATKHMLDTAAQYNLKVMLLIKRPLEKKLVHFTEDLLKYLADEPTLWAYDFFNEPLYFDPIQHRDKNEPPSAVHHRLFRTYRGFQLGPHYSTCRFCGDSHLQPAPHSQRDILVQRKLQKQTLDGGRNRTTCRQHTHQL